MTVPMFSPGSQPGALPTVPTVPDLARAVMPGRCAADGVVCPVCGETLSLWDPCFGLLDETGAASTGIAFCGVACASVALGDPLEGMACGECEGRGLVERYRDGGRWVELLDCDRCSGSGFDPDGEREGWAAA